MTAPGGSLRRRDLLGLVLAWFAGARRAVAVGQDWRDQASATFDVVWQTIADTFYDPTFGGVDWAAAREALRPALAAARTPDEARDVIRTLLGRLQRSHFTLISAPPASEPWPGFAVVAIDVRVTAEGVLVAGVEPGSSAARAGVRRGDVIRAIDGDDTVVSVPSGADRQARFLQWQRVVRALHGTPSSTARLTVWARETGLRQLNVARGAVPGELVTLGNLPPLPVRFDARAVTTPAGRGVGLIRFTAWMTNVAEPFAAAVDRFRQADGIVIDLRGNPGGLAEMTRGIAGHFLSTPALLGRVQMRGGQLEMRANPRRSTTDGRPVEPYAGPLALLVDELTASASECFAGGLQSLGRARVFGERTAGQALPASTKALPNGDVLLYAVGDFVTATGVRLEWAGVVPDEAVAVSVARLAGEDDPVLTEAIRWLDRSGRPR